ncbi:MAG TPA: phage tail sheath C-terminal domain-containing protein [Thermoanaerobaculia bacterium]|nr:phage tail sheath C-terminal domain-containing protein [Thermoanaerobaculia bacterium]
MAEYLAPGVYVEEVDSGIKTIEGVSTSIAGFAGVTARGPVKGLPKLVTSFSEFERNFGGYFDFGAAFAGHNYLPYAVNGFFANGGRQLYISRVLKGDATVAEGTAKGGLITRLRADALVGGTTFNPVTQRGMKIAVVGPPAQVATKVRLVMVKNGIVYQSSDRTVTVVNPATGVVTVNPALDITPTGPATFEAKYTYVMTDIKDLNGGGVINALGAVGGTRNDAIVLKANDKGSWGRDIVVTAAHETPVRAEMDAGGDIGGTGAADSTRIGLKSAKGFYKGAWVEVERNDYKYFRLVDSVDGNIIRLHGPSIAAADLGGSVFVSVCEFRLTVSYGGVTETFSGLTLEDVIGKNFKRRINGESALLDNVDLAGGALNDPTYFPSGDNGLNLVLGTNGTNGTAAPGINDYIGTGDPGDRSGIKALEDIDRISIIAVPGRTDLAVQNALIEQCERLKDRFAIADPANSKVVDILTQRGQFDTKYAAIYFPRILVFDPLTENDLAVPPSGHMAGIYARVDIERGVHKAPANEVVRSITGYEATINKETQDTLNPSPTNVNVFRDFRADGRGLRIWGARVMTSDTEWKYINVRRLFIFLEESIDEGTQWVVFEPNDERLWARVTQSISAFLTRVWRDGALLGTTAEEAFFVKCDRTTMTQDDLDNGRLICIVGVAPVKPAEFVIIRISQFTASAATE